MFDCTIHVLPCHRLPCPDLPCHAMLCLPCHALPCVAMPCLAMLCLAMACFALPCFVLTCHAMPCYTISYCIMFMPRFVVYRDMLQAHNALLHVYASHGQVGKAKQLFSSMQERGPAVDNVSAGTLIAAYAKACCLTDSHFCHHLPTYQSAPAPRSCCFP